MLAAYDVIHLVAEARIVFVDQTVLASSLSARRHLAAKRRGNATHEFWLRI
jgi:hypothetical protein